MYVCVNHKGTSIQGSLPGVLCGHNALLAGPDEARQALDKLSESLGVDFFQAQVMRLDFAQDLIMNHRPPEYFKCFGELRGMNRVMDRSLYYKEDSKRKEAIIYDKGAEMRRKKIPNYLGPEYNNVLRLEWQLKRKVKELLKAYPIGKDLTRIEFFESMQARHKSVFKAIRKVYPVSLDLAPINSPRDFTEALAALKLHEIGMNEVLAYFNPPGRTETASERQARHRMREAIRKLGRLKTIEQPDTLTDELIRKIEG